MEEIKEIKGRMEAKIFNFCAGPAVIADEVLKRAQKALVDYNNTGMSILSISHRGSDFMDLMHKTIKDVKDILKVPDNYEIAFITGGATEQFSDVPKNLSKNSDIADYLVIGHWGRVAVKYAKEFININEVDWDLNLNKNSKYLHITNNETVNGVEIFDINKIYQKAKEINPDMFLVSDMSSNIFSRPIDISKYGVIYACAQKNFGPSGLSVVIIRKDLLDLARDPIEKTRHYKSIIAKDSVLNTPNTFGVYLASCVLDWIKQKGGVEYFAKENARKAKFLYDAIDSSDLYINDVPAEYRSHMNVVFVIKDKLKDKDRNKDRLSDLFLKQAAENGLVNLAGHGSVGGVRASIYNAMSFDGVKALVEFMRDFEKNYE